MTDHTIIAALPGRPPTQGWLTTDRPESSYGQPVVVVDDVAHGTGEVLWIDGEKEVRKYAADHGYTVLTDEDSVVHAQGLQAAIEATE